ncbi:helix-turn-helix transcriptional regulator [Sinomonas halotolerans]|uniref:WYL domain-containing protein n=1 Tax=Sinomonas halotolerans TaxID=1644133 RepID=A0ABU9X0Y6_9MICC
MSEAKTTRLLNLLIALLRTDRGLSRERILRDVYGHDASPWAARGPDDELESVLRMFERDKAELRAMGADLREFEGYERLESAETTTMYTIDAQGFQLPPQRFTAEESAWLALAALACDGAVAGQGAQRALRRLEAAGALPETPPSAIQPRLKLDEPAWEALLEAAENGAEVTFEYEAASTGELLRRRVQPWGLGQRYGQWYLAGHDLDRGGTRLFRLSRIRGEVTAGEPEAFPPPPAGAVHAALESLEALPERTARVRLAEDRALGLRREWKPAGAGPEGWDLGDLVFRDVTVMAETLAGFGDAVVVEDPPELADAVVRRLEGALGALGTPGAPEAPHAPAPRRMTTSAERLDRLTDLVPFLLAGPVTVGEIAARFGLKPRQVRQELQLLAETGPTDAGGFQSYIEVLVEDDVVSIANADELARPRRLSAAEAVTLQLGLQALLPLAGAASGTLMQLMDRVAAAALGERGVPQVLVRTDPSRNAHLLPVLLDAAREGRTLSLTYMNPTKDEVTTRDITPLRVISDGDRWYANSYCHRAQEGRMFRVDRIVALEPAEERPVPEGAAAAGEAVFMRHPGDLDVTVRFAPEARWAESTVEAEEGRDLVDGSRRVRLTVADPAWLAAFLAQFGGAIALEAPEAAITASRAWLERALARYGRAPSGR